MKIWYSSILDAHAQLVTVEGTRVSIGRAPDNDLVLDNAQISDQALVIYPQGRMAQLVPLSLNGCQVNDEEVPCGTTALIEQEGTIKLFPFILNVRMSDDEARAPPRSIADDEMSEVIHSIHRDLLDRLPSNSFDTVQTCDDEDLYILEQHIDEIAKQRCLFNGSRRELLNHIAGHSVRSALISNLIDALPAQNAPLVDATAKWVRLLTATPASEEDLRLTLEYVANDLKLIKMEATSEKLDTIEQGYWSCWDLLAPRLFEDFINYVAIRFIKKQIKDVVFGYGPLEDLLRIPSISEIMVVDRNHIYVEKKGVIQNSGRRFLSDEVTEMIIGRIVDRVGRRIDRAQPLVDARLSDGSRVNAVIPPLAVSGPCITIRKFPSRRMTIDDLIEKNSISRTAAEFLRAAVVSRCNVLVSGGTGSGKTTLLNCLTDFIPDRERIVTIEDTAELQISREHVVRLETRPANVEGAGAYSIRDLVRNSLRMRPDRIIVGECRGGEALDMLQAMNTGHDGSMTTVHANTPRDVVQRLDVLVQQAAALPVSAIRQQIVSAIDLIVQLTRLRDGRRVVAQISEVLDIDEQTGQIRLKDLFHLTSAEGTRPLTPTGLLPTFIDELLEQNLFALDAFYL